MKAVDVETYDSKIFQALMTIVVKNQNDLYAITLKDLCKELQVDINAVNRYLELNYSALRADNVPHLELPVFNSDDTWHYIIQGGGKYNVSKEDKYIIPKGNADALPYLMLDIMKNQSIKTSYEEKFAVILSKTLMDCLEYAHKFDE